jgi:hypothetical protein
VGSVFKKIYIIAIMFFSSFLLLLNQVLSFEDVEFYQSGFGPDCVLGSLIRINLTLSVPLLPLVDP